MPDTKHVHDIGTNLTGAGVYSSICSDHAPADYENVDDEPNIPSSGMLISSTNDYFSSPGMSNHHEVYTTSNPALLS